MTNRSTAPPAPSRTCTKGQFTIPALAFIVLDTERADSGCNVGIIPGWRQDGTGVLDPVDAIQLKETTLEQAVTSGALKVEGRQEAFGEFLGLLDTFPFWFNIVTP